MLCKIWSYIIEQFTNLDFWDAIQIVGLALSFLYLWFEFHQKSVMWFVSATCSMIYACVYYHSKIYADMSFSCFNICMCIYGFIKWLNNDDKNEKDYGIVWRHFRLKESIIVLSIAIVIWIIIFSILKFMTDSPIPILDALTTMLNIIGTWVLAQKIIEVWGIWFFVNLISLYVYNKRGLHLSTLLLYSFYLCASVYGYIKWKKKGQCVA